MHSPISKPKRGIRLFSFSALLLVAGTLGTLFIFSSGSPGPGEGTGEKPAAFGQVQMPRQVDFCGETMPLQDEEVRERFEREMMITIYDFATTTMILKRLNRWEQPMRQILREEGVPEDFIYLMVAESAVRNATSLAGAQGYWQFMPQTGRDFQLRQDAFMDERNHPLKSARAACRYLKESYRQFNSWTLAAASYNMGAGGLSYNMRSQAQQNYYDLHLNQETSRYIFRIAAFKYVLRNPEKYGYHVPMKDRYTPPATRVVRVNQTTNLVKFAADHGTTYKMIMWLNPWLNGLELPVRTGESWELLVPVAKPRISKLGVPDENSDQLPAIR
ncbi:MAG: lytic transglycosylase domain-containing protein [Bacteroidetes bacterium]|nr:lytic transglycosylase domain-containing protein [Bacteroidota bacterium]